MTHMAATPDTFPKYLLLNAEQAVGAAGDGLVTVRTFVTGGSCTLEVSDNGPGLAPRSRENLFRPFAGSGRPGGSGLGLAIARELMRAHGGDLLLIESTGEGTLFRLELPRRRAGAGNGR